MKATHLRQRHGERLKEKAFDILALYVQQAYFAKHAANLYCQNLQRKVLACLQKNIQDKQAHRELEAEI
jgi:hypothetical protein